jgi:hypothetical protein
LTEVRGPPLHTSSKESLLSAIHVWQVQQVKDGMATCIKPGDAAQASPARAPEHGVALEPVRWAVDELLVVRQFGEPIFPSLVPVDAVANGPAEAPWHTLIEADNYHALQLLEYLYAGQVDCIYIVPPYNTGARDWKYNNDYVDGNDGWRHSKWLAFMDKRLKLAKRLLKPNAGEGNWQWYPETLRERMKQGRVRIGGVGSGNSEHPGRVDVGHSDARGARRRRGRGRDA